MYCLRMSVRNARRHARRSLATVSVIAVGFVAINLFGGYTLSVFRGLREQAVRGEGLGHLTVARAGFFEHGAIHPARYLIAPEQWKRLKAILAREPAIVLATPRLAVTGLISNGHRSTVFLGEGVVPADARRLRGDLASEQDGMLDDNNTRSALLAKQLASALALEPKGSAVLLTSTSEGLANALDVDVHGVFDTGNLATNDKAIVFSFELAQRLFDTEGAQRIVLLLQDVSQTLALRETLTRRLRSEGFDMEVRTWEELSASYLQVKNFLTMIFMFIACIVFVVVLMSVTNMTSMSVVERTREIGTLRALGMKRPVLARLFTQESVSLALFACLVGTPVTILIAHGVNELNIRYTPPNSSDTVPLRVDMELASLALSTCVLSLIAGAAALTPAWRAARSPIADALSHT